MRRKNANFWSNFFKESLKTSFFKNLVLFLACFFQNFACGAKNFIQIRVFLVYTKKETSGRPRGINLVDLKKFDKIFFENPPLTFKKNLDAPLNSDLFLRS